MEPAPWLTNFLVACCLLVLSCFYSLSATSSKDENGSFPYNTIFVPLLAEALKLAISTVSLALELNGRTAAEAEVLTAWTKASLLQAAIPGIAYQILNNLNFVTLYYVDVATFQTLSNLKILATGVASHYLLGRRLSRGRWLSLVLLTLGALTTQLGRFSGSAAGNISSSVEVPWVGYASALTVAAISAVLGVFTEKFHKDTAATSLHWQNAQLYSFGLIANMAAVVAMPGSGGLGFGSNPFASFNRGAYLSVLALTLIGLTISFLLRFADSIVKTYATALSPPFSALAAKLSLNAPITPECVVGMVVMMISMSFFYGEASLFDHPDYASHDSKLGSSSSSSSSSTEAADSKARIAKEASSTKNHEDSAESCVMVPTGTVSSALNSPSASQTDHTGQQRKENSHLGRAVEPIWKKLLGFFD